MWRYVHQEVHIQFQMKMNNLTTTFACVIRGEYVLLVCAPVNTQWSLGWLTVKERPWQSGILGLLCSSSSLQKDVQFQRRHNTPRIESSHHSFSLWVWKSVVSFSLLFFSLHLTFCYCQKSLTWIHQLIEHFFVVIDCEILIFLLNIYNKLDVLII